MSPRLDRTVRVGGALLVMAGVAALWGAVRVPLADAPPATGESPGVTTLSDSTRPRLPGTDVAARDVFRPDRALPPIPFDPLMPSGVAPPAPTPPPRPTLVLVGLVLGRPRAALIRGLEGAPEARLLAEGEELAGVRVLRVTADSVVLRSGRDTVRLALPREAR